jgi:hypothetical protein
MSNGNEEGRRKKKAQFVPGRRACLSSHNLVSPL